MNLIIILLKIAKITTQDVSLMSYDLDQEKRKLKLISIRTQFLFMTRVDKNGKMREKLPFHPSQQHLSSFFLFVKT